MIQLNVKKVLILFLIVSIMALLVQCGPNKARHGTHWNRIGKRFNSIQSNNNLNLKSSAAESEQDILKLIEASNLMEEKRYIPSDNLLYYLMDMYERKMSRKQSNEERDSVEATSY
ncbi:unnamed protein product [Brachionus calyciflorus]|uniref:Uncharacterized protein n=1 Tax=Brachionus calyciflorus TaxID=104777 RepID=A0A813MID3_9BILA|nr:unnamed protein product [Brachionus calyciflorus]